jgi:nitrogen regulatory protein P-II 2
MQLHPMKLITIVGEEILRDQLVRKIREAGAKGCSYASTQGVGSHEARHNDVFSANFELKVVCPEKVADVVMTLLAEHYFGKYAIVAWISDVEVVRPGHFAKA